MRRQVPYELTYVPETAKVAVRGDARLMQNLVHFTSAEVHGDLSHPNAYISIPATRETFLAVEANASPSIVSEYYIHARPFYVSTDISYLYQTWSHYGISLARTLLPHQAEFCAFAQMRRGVLNASEQGLGKTTMGWVMAQLWESYRCLVVTSKSLVPEWQAEYRKAFYLEPALMSVPLGQGGKGARETAIRACRNSERPIAIIINYDVLDDMERALLHLNLDTVIFDESWRIKNIRAQTSKVAVRLADRCRHVLCLTGTPIGNSVGDFWNQLRAINGPGMEAGFSTRIKAFDAFMTRFAEFTHVRFNQALPPSRKPVGVADPAGLMQLISPVWFRATKATCLNLPPKVHRTVELELDSNTLQLYRRVEDQGEAALGAEMSLADNRVVQLRLQQMTGGFIPTPVPALLNGVEPIDYHCHGDPDKESELSELQMALDYIWEMVPNPVNPKLEWLTTFAHEVLVGDPTIRVLVWFRFNHELHYAHDQLASVIGEHRVAKAYGGTKPAELEDIKQSFNSRHSDGVQVMLCQWKKMAYGHNLQAADHHVRYSHTWSHIEWVQSEDRSHRMGREGAVTYTNLVVRGTVDRDIISALNRHEDVATRVAPDTTRNLQ